MSWCASAPPPLLADAPPSDTASDDLIGLLVDRGTPEDDAAKLVRWLKADARVLVHR